MKRKYSDPLVFSNILLAGTGEGTINVSPAQSGTSPDPDGEIDPTLFLGAQPQVVMPDTSPITMSPAGTEESEGATASDTVESLVDSITDQTTALEAATEGENASDAAEIGN